MQSWPVVVLLQEVHITTLTYVLEKGISSIHLLIGFLFLFVSLDLVIVTVTLHIEDSRGAELSIII